MKGVTVVLLGGAHSNRIFAEFSLESQTLPCTAVADLHTITHPLTEIVVTRCIVAARRTSALIDINVTIAVQATVHCALRNTALCSVLPDEGCIVQGTSNTAINAQTVSIAVRTGTSIRMVRHRSVHCRFRA